MDFGFPCFDGFLASGSNQTVSHVSPSEANNQKDQQFRLARLERPSGEWRTASNYMPADTADFSVPKIMLLNQGATLSIPSDSVVYSDARQPGKMLNLPLLRPEVAPFPSKDDGLAEKTPLNFTGFTHYQSSPMGYESGGYGNGNLNPGVSGPSRGPFTPSQRVELEYQTLIFKYISANVPVPPTLLTPLKIKPVYLYQYGSSGGFYGPDSMGWGSLDMDIGSPVDTEPGRCRRTDGKKWRCSRDVVSDQKYCERHLNRGRHRSRKPVEGQTVSSTTQTTNKVMTQATSISPLVISNEPVNGIKKQQSWISEADTTVNLKPDESSFTVPEPIEEESSQLEFGRISSDSSSKRRRYVNSSDCEPFLMLNVKETEDEHPLRQFIEDWPAEECNRSVINWPEELKADWTKTQLSMSIPSREKVAFSPLRSSREFDTYKNGFGGE